MHTGKTINIFVPKLFVDKKYIYQYFTNFKYCTIQKKLFNLYLPIFGNLTNDLKVF